ncbi:MAG: hypothetical protein B6U95_01520 [Thermofilum sp. ex4484_82]|nr:MAG: hypothetical protein B6U95_01520 [Thermofilum sp. ex4484_82]OYT39632.1 MAG: hypothetical protein B6U96_01525 [Archaeoglobales archaeon ex4484_92]
MGCIKMSLGFQYTYASITDRFFAHVVDGLLLRFAQFGVGLVFGFFVALVGLWSSIEPIVNIVGFGLDILTIIAYFTFFEGFFGQTIGKKLWGVRVIMEDGSKCSFGAALTRNIVRFIDFLPVAYIIGYISISKSPKSQRLGDRIARTIVVKKTTAPPPPPPPPPPP